MKLTFYGLYKQATVGPCQEVRPSIFNYVNRAKWYDMNVYEYLFFYITNVDHVGMHGINVDR